jgi:type II secretory pathway pseudopilin PulG
MTSAATSRQRGITLVGLIFVLGVLGVIGVLGLKIVPTAIEFMSIKKAIVAAKAGGSSPAEVRASFDRQATTGYIESISGKDLDIVKDGDQIEVNVAYQKKIPLIGPASLLIDYVATTASGAQKKTAAF